MRDPDFPDDLCDFIQLCTPSIEAVELLLLLARNAERLWTAGELAQSLRPNIVSESLVRDYLNGFTGCRVVEKRADGRYAYLPPPPDTATVIAALEKAYNERPVSLVRLIYALKDKKIRSFADAFKFRKG
ncbi:MAG: hypothetical protein ACM3SS_20465 [Rhodospirillaceae bacterium]